MRVWMSLQTNTHTKAHTRRQENGTGVGREDGCVRGRHAGDEAENRPRGVEFLEVAEHLGDAAAAEEAAGHALDVDGAAYVQVVQADAGHAVLHTT